MRAFGIRKVFGNPGSTELPFLSDWPDDIDYVLGLQEASVVGMADGYAQATRNAGFVNLHSGAGVGNALGNIYTAHRNQTPLVITAGQQARSILPWQPFLYAERASEFPRPYVKFSVEPARPEDVPAAIARAYYVAMQPPCGPTFVSIPIDDWTHPAQPLEARKISREIGPDPDAMQGAGSSARGEQAPCPGRRPRRRSRGSRRADGEGGGESQGRGLGQPVFGALFVSRSGIRNLQASCMRRRAQLSEALRGHDLVVVIGAPVFTFHVEGHAAIFDGATTIFQITDDADAAAVPPTGTSIVATMKPALAMLLELLPETKRATPAGRELPAAPARRRPDSSGIPAAFAFRRDARGRRAGGGSAVAPAAAAEIHADARPGQLLHHGERRAWLQPAGVRRHGARPPERRTVCLIGDGSAMYSIQALWTAAQRKLPLTVVVINNAGYGAMRSFSQVMQVRNVPGLDLPGIDFVKIAEGMGCDAVRVNKAADLAPALARALAHQGVSLVDVIVDSAVPLLYARQGRT